MEQAKTQQSVTRPAKRAINNITDGAVGEYFHKAEDKIGAATDAVVNQYEKTREYLHDTDFKSIMSDCKSVIVKHPVLSALTGIGIGYLVGKMISRRG